MYNLHDLFKLMNLDKKTRDEIINSHSILRKNIPKDSFKRKPKYLDTLLAKKLEDHKHRLIEQYFSLTEFKKIFEITEFDELRKEQYMIKYENIMKLKDSETKNYSLSQLYSQIKQDIQYFIGKEENQDEMKNMPLEDQIQQNIILGSKDFKK